MSYLNLDRVSFTYPNGTRAVDGVSLAIGAGERVAIVGQNGAGKTTAAKLMNGLVKPTSGVVTVDGMNTADHTTAQISRKVGYVFQNPDDQIFHNDVRSEIEFGPRNVGLSGAELDEAVMSAARLAGVEEFLNENPYNLPFSTRKFVTIAAVIAMGTPALIFDEPTAGQDRTGMGILARIIDELSGQGRTVLTITHDMEFVVRNFDRVVVMAQRHVIADTDKRSVFWRHDTLAEARLKQPFVSDLAYELGVPGRVLDTAELVTALSSAPS